MIPPRPSRFRIPHSAFRILLLLALAVFAASQSPAASPSLLYQWDFNGPGAGTTVTPTVYPQSSPSDPATGVLTMSQEHVNSDFTLSDPAATNLYGPAGSGVFYNATTNPNDRALNNSGTIYDLPNQGDIGQVAGMLSSNNAGFFTPAAGSNLSASAGSHTQITLTTWVKLDPTALTIAPGEFTVQPRLLTFGLPVGGGAYDGQTGSGITGIYLGLYNDNASNKDTLQFFANGAAGVAGKGLLGPSGMFDATAPATGQPYKSGWMFLALTEDAAATQDSNTVASVQMYLGDQTDPLGPAVSTATLPISSTNPASPGPINLANNSAYIGNRVSGPMDRGLGALIDDVRIYDGALDQYELNRVRQNLPVTLPGDFNLDGVVNSADVSAMMSALSDLADFQSTNQIPTADLLAIGDLNGDGVINNLDLQSLVSNLANSSPSDGSITPVPEPAAFLSMFLGGLGLLLAFGSRRVAISNRVRLP